MDSVKPPHLDSLKLLEHDFPGWRKKYETYIIPPCYKIAWPEVPEFLPPEYSFVSEKYPDRNKGSYAENYILDAFAYYFHYTSQPAFIFHNYTGLRSDKNDELLAEIDMLVVHRKFGIIVIQIKAVTSVEESKISKNHYDARKNLKKVNNHLKNRFRGAKITGDVIMKNVIAMPYQSSQALYSNTRDDYVHLCKDDLRSLDNFDEWWNDITRDNQIFTSYETIIPLLLSSPNIKVNIDEAVKLLITQSFLKNCKICLGNPHKKISVATQSQNDSSVLKKEMEYITTDQSKVWTTQKQIIYGVYGSGKTVLAQCKAADLACSQKKVLVIVPNHLKKVYKEFFNLHVNDELNKKYIILVSKSDFYRNFCTYEILAQSSHVIVDELLCLGKDLFQYPLQSYLFLDVLCYLFNHSKRTVWVIPHLYYLAEESLCGNNSVTSLAVQFMHKFKNFQSTKLKITMRTSKKIHDYESRLEFASLDNYPFENHHFKDEYFQLAINSTLGHSITGPCVKIITYFDESFKNYHLHKRNCEAEKCPFYFFCAHVILAEIIQLEKMQVQIKDIAITADFNILPNIECLCFYLMKLQGFLKYAPNITICRYEELASLEWPVVIHVKDNKIAKEYFNEQNTSLFIRNQHSLVISRCMVQYIVICHPGDLPVFSDKTFQGFQQYCKKEESKKEEIDENFYHEAYERYKRT